MTEPFDADAAAGTATTAGAGLGQEDYIINPRPAIGGLGVFPDTTQPKSSQEMASELYRMQPGQLQRLQQTMWLAGLYGDDSILNREMPVWGRPDARTVAAYDELLGEAFQFSAAGNPKALEELLDERLRDAQRPGGIHERAAGIGVGGAWELDDEVVRVADVSYTTTDPATLRESLRVASRERMGRELNDDELGMITDVVLAEERSVLNSQASNELSNARSDAMTAAQLEMASRRQALQGEYDSYLASLGMAGTSGGGETSYLSPEILSGGPNSNTLAWLKSLEGEYGEVFMDKGYDPFDPRYAEGRSAVFSGTPEKIAKMRDDFKLMGQGVAAPVQQVVAIGNNRLYVKMNEGARRPPLGTAAQTATPMVGAQRFIQAVMRPGIEGTNWTGAGNRRGSYQIREEAYNRTGRTVFGDGEIPKDPSTQQRIATAEAERLHAKYGNWDEVARAWILGERTVDDARSRGWSSPIDEGTRRATDAITGSILSRMGQAGSDAGLTNPDLLGASSIDEQFGALTDVSGLVGRGVGGGNISVVGGRLNEYQDYDTASRAKEEYKKQHDTEIVGASAAMNWRALTERLTNGAY